MESLNYIWNKDWVKRIVGLVMLMCFYYRFFIFNDLLSLYLAAIAINLTFSIFPFFFYYLLNIYHQYKENVFVHIRCKDYKKQIVMEETLLVASYALCIWIVELIPCVFQLRLEAIFYSLDIALFNFSLFLLVTHLVEILSGSLKFYTVLAIFAALVGAFYLFFLYSGIIDITPLVGYPNVRTLFSAICCIFSLCLSYYRMRDSHV